MGGRTPTRRRIAAARLAAATSPAVPAQAQTPVVYLGARESALEVARDVEIMKRLSDENSLRQAE